MTTRRIDDNDWPRCTKCDMPVENFYIDDTGNVLNFVAQCHGKEQLVKVPDSFWDQELGHTVSIGPAFTEND